MVLGGNRHATVVPVGQSGKGMSSGRTTLANFTTSVIDTEPLEQRRRGENRFHSARSCAHICGSWQKRNPVFCSDDTHVDDQTRSMDKGTGKSSCHWVHKFLARCAWANGNQLLQQWVTGLWLGRDTLSHEHLIGTAGVMRVGQSTVSKNQHDGYQKR